MVWYNQVDTKVLKIFHFFIIIEFHCCCPKILRQKARDVEDKDEDEDEDNDDDEEEEEGKSRGER